MAIEAMIDVQLQTLPRKLDDLEWSLAILGAARRVASGGALGEDLLCRLAAAADALQSQSRDAALTAKY
jgi:hypothetical protein